jgi:hypothetical protein
MRSTKSCLEKIRENQLELVSGVHLRSLLETIIGHRGFDNLVEEELIGLVEIGAKTLVHEVDELRKGNRLRVGLSAIHLRRSVQRPGAFISQADRPLSDFLQPVILESHLVVELICWAAAPAWQLGAQMPEKRILAFEI